MLACQGQEHELQTSVWKVPFEGVRNASRLCHVDDLQWHRVRPDCNIGHIHAHVMTLRSFRSTQIAALQRKRAKELDRKA